MKDYVVALRRSVLVALSVGGASFILYSQIGGIQRDLFQAQVLAAARVAVGMSKEELLHPWRPNSNTSAPELKYATFSRQFPASERLEECDLGEDTRSSKREEPFQALTQVYFIDWGMVIPVELSNLAVATESRGEQAVRTCGMPASVWLVRPPPDRELVASFLAPLVPASRVQDAWLRSLDGRVGPQLTSGGVEIELRAVARRHDIEEENWERIPLALFKKASLEGTGLPVVNLTVRNDLALLGLSVLGLALAVRLSFSFGGCESPSSLEPEFPGSWTRQRRQASWSAFSSVRCRICTTRLDCCLRSSRQS